MNESGFEELLDQITERLDGEAKVSPFKSSTAFEQRVRELISSCGDDLVIDFDPHPHVFPDICIKEFGVEVKFTKSDSWRSVANSILEGGRTEEVKFVYLIYGKMGGVPAVRWARYADSVIHVRTSHALRFEVEVPAEESLFDKLNISYDEFRVLSLERKMEYIRAYAKHRLKRGERLWWLPPDPEEEHTLPIKARLYMALNQPTKRQLRAEAALLCPQIVKSSRYKHKYDDVVLYLLTYHGVLCPQARDLFSAGSVALRGNDARGGNYILRALKDIESEMKQAAQQIEDALFEEYWGECVPYSERINRWLELADQYASGWKPSEVLFLD